MNAESHSEQLNTQPTQLETRIRSIPAAMLRGLSVFVFVISAITLLIAQFTPLIGETELWARVALPIPLLLLTLLRFVSVRYVSWLAVGLMWVAATICALRYSDVSGPIASAFIVVAVLSAMLIEHRRWWIVLIASLAASAGIGFAQLAGWIVPVGIGYVTKPMELMIQVAFLLGISLAAWWWRRQIVEGLSLLRRKSAEISAHRGLVEQRSAEIATKNARLQLEGEERQQTLQALKRTEVALRASERRYRTVFDHDPNAVIVAELFSQKIVDANGSASRLFGYHHDVLCDLAVDDLSPAEQPDWVKQDADLLALDKATFHALSVYEWAFERAEGEQFPGEVRLVRLPATDGETQLFQMSIVDITDRNYALRALRESEARYRTLVENAPDAILLIDADKHCVVEANENASLLFGKTAVELMTTDLQAVLPLHSAEFASFQDVAVAVNKYGQANVEFELIKAEGAPTTLEAHVIKMPAGDRNLLRASISDVTRRRNAEDMIAALPGHVAVLSLEGDLLWANAGFVERFDLPDDRLVGLNIRRFVSNDEFDHMLTALRQDRGKRQFPLAAQTFNGQPLQINSTTLVIEFRQRAAVLLLVENAAAPNNIVPAPQAESDGVMLTLAQAEEVDTLIDMVLNESTIALSKLDAEQAARGYIEKTLQAAQRVADISRDAQGMMSDDGTPLVKLDLNQLLETNEALFELTVQPHLAIEYALADGLPQIMADSDTLKRLVAGLIINASEAIGTDLGLIVVETERLMISAETQSPYITHTGTLLKPGLYVSVCITDNGIGYNSAALRRLFDPATGGAAARLASIVRIVRGHHGGLKVTSEEGVGSQFTAVFPAVAASLDFQDSATEPVVSQS